MTISSPPHASCKGRQLFLVPREKREAEMRILGKESKPAPVPHAQEVTYPIAACACCMLITALPGHGHFQQYLFSHVTGNGRTGCNTKISNVLTPAGWIELYKLFILRMPPNLPVQNPSLVHRPLSLFLWCGASPRIDVVDLEKYMCDCHGSLGLLASWQALWVRGNSRKAPLLLCPDTEEINL